MTNAALKVERFMTSKELADHLERLSAKATPAPWEADSAVARNGEESLAIYHRPKPNHIVEVIESPDKLNGECIHNSRDQAFIVALRNNLPQIIAALRGEVRFKMPELPRKKPRAIVK